MSGPVFRNLRAWRPEARIVAACYDEHLEPLSLLAEIDEVLAIPRHRAGGPAESTRAWLRFVRRLRRERFDIVYDLLQTDRVSLRSPVVTLLAGAPVRLSCIKQKRRFRHRVYNRVVEWEPLLGETHTVDLYLTGLTALGAPIETRSISIDLPEREMEAVRRRMEGVVARKEGPLVVVHPGAGSIEKQWPAERIAATIDFLQLDCNARVLVVAGRGESQLLHDIRAHAASDVAFMDEALSVRELAALLREADLFFGHDSGPMHLAAAVGTPVVALFGASSTTMWRPLGERHAVLQPSMPCDACPFAGSCRPPDPYYMLCVRRISDHEVREALRKQLAAVTSTSGGAAKRRERR